MNNNFYFSPNSMFDEFGRVFFYNGKVYRAISRNATQECLELLNQTFFKELIDLSLIPNTKISELSVPGHDLVLEHEKLLITHQHEWSFSMFKDAALMILHIQAICDKNGYELKDAHTLNVLFKGHKPMYIDIGSFQKKKTNLWFAKEEFINSFYIPLCFWSEGKFYITRKLLENKFYKMQTIPEQRLFDSDLLNLLNTNIYKYSILFRNKNIYTSKNIKTVNIWTNFFNKLVSIYRRKVSKPFNILITSDELERIKKKIESFEFPQSQSLWKGYHSKFYKKEGKVELSVRFKMILNIIHQIKTNDSIESILDLAGNEGLMSFEIKNKLNIKRVILSDYDENALEIAYRNSKEYNNDINIILLNFMFPANIDDVSKRIKSDLVLALAITHHLILTSNFVLATIFERIKAYSKKYVLIEFMPKGLWSVEYKEEVEIPEFYTIDWFKNEFEKYFQILQIEQLEVNRILFVGKIKTN